MSGAGAVGVGCDFVVVGGEGVGDEADGGIGVFADASSGEQVMPRAAASGAMVARDSSRA
ncbi:hypothetical protein [Rothia nasimurium]|uniref:hypothetical protein n=1 Tax=Rothia nasimurium TaxID=85336 RepID=UPI0016279760|nr:hypothetical protein [Rothia nasimurium]